MIVETCINLSIKVVKIGRKLRETKTNNEILKAQMDEVCNETQATHFILSLKEMLIECIHFVGYCDQQRLHKSARKCDEHKFGFDAETNWRAGSEMFARDRSAAKRERSFARENLLVECKQLRTDCIKAS
jgi:hypothetical protein